MTLGNMYEQGVRHLIAYCHNDSCRRQALIDPSSYPDDTPVPWFQSRATCGKRGSKGRWIDVRPNWKEQPVRPTKLRFD
jgi:transposase